MSDDCDSRAFHPLAAAPIEEAIFSPSPPGEHDWRPGGRGFVCARCRVQKAVRTIARGPRRGLAVAEFYLGDRRLRLAPQCEVLE